MSQTSWRAHSMLAALAVALLATSVVSAYSPYSPAWSRRAVISAGSSNYLGENVGSIDADDSHLYAAFLVKDPNYGWLGIMDVGVQILNPSDGTELDSTRIYGSNTIINMSSAYIWARGTQYIYVTGRYHAILYGTGGAYVLALNKYDLTIAYQALIQDNNNYRFYPTSICIDTSGHIYVTGFRYSSSSKIMNASIAVLPTDLSTYNLYYDSFYYSSYRYNSTATSCAYGFDGYMYIVEQVLYYSGRNFPLNLSILKTPVNNFGNIITRKHIRLYNSQSYVVSEHTHWAEIDANATHLAIAFSYADELPSPTNPTAGGAVAVLDHNLNVVKRYNLTTDLWEFLDSVAMGHDGTLLVGGRTANDYGTGLGTTYLKSIVLELTPGLNVAKAVIYGGSDAGSAVLNVALGGDGEAYAISFHLTDTEAFYDVTDSLTQAQATGVALQIGQGDHLAGPELEAIRIPEQLARKLPSPDRLSYSVINESVIDKSLSDDAPRLVQEKPAARGSIGVESLTPGGESSLLIVRFSEALTPPVPIPEPYYIWLIVLATTAIIIYLKRFSWQAS